MKKAKIKQSVLITLLALFTISITSYGNGLFESDDFKKIKEKSETSQTTADKKDRYFTTSDGVRLHYRVSGSGIPLVIFPGYTQDASSFEKNYEELEKHFTVYCLDYRWHGLSESPQYGVHIYRFAMDAKEMLDDARIKKFYLFAHSMGNTVAWSFLSLFGQDRVIKYILGDEAPCLITDPSWTAEEKETYTGSPTDKDLWTAWRRPRPAGSPKLTFKEEMMAKLLTEHLSNDWRDIIPTINVPTLVLMAEKGTFNSKLLFTWFTTNIKGSRLKVIEGAPHPYYASHPEIFNQILIDFFVNKID